MTRKTLQQVTLKEYRNSIRQYRHDRVTLTTREIEQESDQEIRRAIRESCDQATAVTVWERRRS